MTRHLPTLSTAASGPSELRTTDALQRWDTCEVTASSSPVRGTPQALSRRPDVEGVMSMWNSMPNPRARRSRVLNVGS